jgi:FAD-linked sulfhydryl oxidase
MTTPTWFNENCPADSVALGRAAWTLLHTTAAYYPDRPAPSQMDSMRAFMTSFIDNYPCFSVRHVFLLFIYTKLAPLLGRV